MKVQYAVCKRDTAAIQKKVGGLCPSLTIYESVPSTNDLLRKAAQEGAPEYTVIAARQQTAGKGRQGRSFFSPPACGLYLSMLFRPQFDAQTSLSITSMAAVAAANAIEKCAGCSVQIKWVNDLMIHEKKVCGILAEAQYQAGSMIPEYVVLGIGINLLPPPEGFPPELQSIATAVYEQADMRMVFPEMASMLITELRAEYAGIKEKHYLSEYRSRLCVLHRSIMVIDGDKEYPAEAIDVDDDLRLLVRTESGQEQWRSSGEIRIRMAADEASFISEKHPTP